MYRYLKKTILEKIKHIFMYSTVIYNIDNLTHKFDNINDNSRLKLIKETKTKKQVDCKSHVFASESTFNKLPLSFKK